MTIKSTSIKMTREEVMAKVGGINWDTINHYVGMWREHQLEEDNG